MPTTCSVLHIHVHTSSPFSPKNTLKRELISIFQIRNLSSETQTLYYLCIPCKLLNHPLPQFPHL